MKSISTTLRCAVLFAARCQAIGFDATYTNNPVGTSYIAELPTNMSIQGTIITGMAQQNGTQFEVNFANLPSQGGPFLYHIHVNPVPSNGNCTATGGHLDPAGIGESPPCDPADRKTCQAGDLSGMFGNITTADGTFRASYTDPYVSLSALDPAFIGNRSFVIHFANLTRIACANFASPAQALLGRPPAPAGGSAPSSAPSGTQMNPFAPGASLNPFLPVASDAGTAVAAAPTAAAQAAAQTTSPALFQGAGSAVAASRVWIAVGAVVAVAAVGVGW